jgi:hypothetical protein
LSGNRVTWVSGEIAIYRFNLSWRPFAIIINIAQELSIVRQYRVATAKLATYR